MVRALALAAGLVAGVAEAEAEEPLTLALPVACELGKTCFLQSYVDVSGPGEEPRDHACGIATFKGHTGTDFRLLSAQAAEQGVAVLAAAKGRVLKVHNGMPDALVRPRRPAIIEGLACGNHVVIDHGQGWQTQYCHLRLDSIKVTPGQEALPGETLGLVGHSGNAGYAHLHFMVRKDDLVVDPFSGVAPAAKCPTDGGARMPLWDAKALLAMPYRMSEFIEAGFADARVSVGLLEQGQAKLTSPNRTRPGWAPHRSVRPQRA